MDFSLSIVERKIPPNQPPFLPAVPVVSMDVKRRLGHLALVPLCRSKIWMNHRVDSYHVLECYSMVLKQNIVSKIFHFHMNLRVHSVKKKFICGITSVAVHKPSIVLAGPFQGTCLSNIFCDPS